MAFDPASLDLERLFVDPKMFDAPDAWRRAGFDVLPRSPDPKKIMVASHDSAPGYLFKRYANDVDPSKQRKNYEQRVKGADKARKFIIDRDFRRLVVPRKELYRLPERFGDKAYVLVVARLQLLDDAASSRAYARIDDQALKELCIAIFKFKGLDSAVMNVPWTSDERIAFIDTEHWDRDPDKQYLRHIRQSLSRENQARADEIFERLEDGDDDLDDL